MQFVTTVQIVCIILYLKNEPETTLVFFQSDKVKLHKHLHIALLSYLVFTQSETTTYRNS